MTNSGQTPIAVGYTDLKADKRLVSWKAIEKKLLNEGAHAEFATII